MRKLFLIAAAMTVAVVSQGQAAPRQKSEYCKLSANQRNVESWNEHYGCLDTPARQAFAEAPKPKKGPNSEFCELSKFQRNAPSWDEYYGCTGR